MSEENEENIYSRCWTMQNLLIQKYIMEFPDSKVVDKYKDEVLEEKKYKEKQISSHYAVEHKVMEYIRNKINDTQREILKEALDYYLPKVEAL